MRMTALPRLTLALAVAAALTGCPEKDAAGTQAAATTDAQPAADAGYKIDDSKLPPMNSF